jgi:two-component system OmpR family response regulator
MIAANTENKPNTKILLVEDDRNFGDVLKSYLEMHGYDVDLAVDGIDGFEHYRRGTYDLCILDVMMPRKDGFYPCERHPYQKCRGYPSFF